MIRPAQSDASLLADIAAAEVEAPEALHLWWLGQSGFLVSHQKIRFLFDPYLSDSLTRKYAATDRPHTRMTERVIAPEKLEEIALVTSSHNHTDHLDAESLLPIFEKNPDAKLILPAPNGDVAAARLGENARARFVPLGIGESKSVGEIQITGVAAAHEILSPEFMGFVVNIGAFSLYHSGDTIPYPGMEAALRAHRVDIALLPINGRLPERGVSGNLWGDEAAQLARSIGARLAVPCHYEMFTFNTETPELFEKTCQQIGQPCKTLRAGERLSMLK